MKFTTYTHEITGPCAKSRVEGEQEEETEFRQSILKDLLVVHSDENLNLRTNKLSQNSASRPCFGGEHSNFGANPEHV